MVIYTMVSKANAKVIAALAVFMMMFAGFAFVVTGDEGDAKPVPVEPTAVWTIEAGEPGVIVSIAFNDVIVDIADAALLAEDYKYTAYYTALLKDGWDENMDAEVAAAYLNIRGYIQADEETLIIPFEDLENADVKLAVAGAVVTLCDVTYTPGHEGEWQYIATGVDSFITYDIADATVIEDAVADAVAIYADYVSPEALATAVADAVAVAEATAAEAEQAAIDEIVASYDGYISPEEAQALVDAAVKEALANVSDYIYTQEDLDAAVEAAADGAIENFLNEFLTPAEITAIEKDVAIALINDPTIDVDALFISLVKETITAKAVEEATAGLYTKEQVDAAVATATAGMYTQAQVDEMIAAQPVVENSMWMYIAILFIIVTVALAVFLVYTFVLKPKMAVVAPKESA